MADRGARSRSGEVKDQKTEDSSRKWFQSQKVIVIGVFHSFSNDSKKGMEERST